MADILSQEEIDSLLDVIDEEDNGYKEFLTRERQITLYDFKRPSRVSRDQLRIFRIIHDMISRDLAIKMSHLTEYLVEVQLHSVDQMSYGEFLMSLPNPTLFNVFELKPFSGSFVLEINPSIVFPIIDRLLGGDGESYNVSREFSDIELNLFDKVIQIFLNSLRDGWIYILETAPFLVKKYSSPNDTYIVNQNEIVIMLTMEIIIGHSSGMVNIAYPVKNINSILDKFSIKGIRGIS